MFYKPYLKCYCHVNDFIQYCATFDDKHKQLHDLYSKFKQETRKDKIKVNDSGLGIAIDLDTLCFNCNVNIQRCKCERGID